MNTPQSQPEVYINVRFLPFGHVTFEIKPRTETPVEAEKESFFYVEPKTTNPQAIELSLGPEEGDYGVPQTTSGFLC